MFFYKFPISAHFLHLDINISTVGALKLKLIKCMASIQNLIRIDIIHVVDVSIGCFFEYDVRQVQI